MNDVLVKIEGLSKTYVVKKSALARKTLIRAVNNVSFQIKRSEILGLIGESGSGKTTLGNMILKLIKADNGVISYDNRDITALDTQAMRTLRKDIQVVFQLAQETLDPKMTIEELVQEPLLIHRIVPTYEVAGEVGRLLNLVGLAASEKDKFPYQLSGGQRQRVGIARAIASRPKFVVCDEPVSALDVSVQGQILNLLLALKQELDLTYLFISHDLKVVKHICDRIAVMHQGRIVEIGSKAQVIECPENSYTKDLVGSML